MQAFKFAFETVMIGALALPWLILMIHLASPRLFCVASNHTTEHCLAVVPKELRAPLIGIAAFTFAYLAGSAILPVAGEFLNDKDLIGQILPTEQQIQEMVYHSLVDKPGLALAASPIEVARFTPATPGDWRLGGSPEDFLFRESALLLNGTDACERLNRLHERISVLSGATFNAFVLLLVCCFAWCAMARTVVQSRIWRWAAFVPSASVAVLALVFGISDLRHLNVTDLPILEAGLLLLGGFGVYITAIGTRLNLRLYAWTSLFAIFFTVMSYGGYACTEVSYDRDVYASYQSLRMTAVHPIVKHVAPGNSTEE